MKPVVVGLVLVMGLVLNAVAGPKAATVTLDVTTYTPPAGWTRADQKAGTEYTATNNEVGAAASILVMRTIAGVTDARANFDKAWANFITATLPDAPAPTFAPAVTLDGWQLVRGTTTYTFQGRSGTTTLLVATRDAQFAIVLVTTIGTAYQKDVEQFFKTVRFASTSTAPTTKPAEVAKVELSGRWGFSTGGAMGPGQFAAWLSDRREYAFDGSGNYTFLRRHNVDRDPDMSLIRERGTYRLDGDVLTLTPTKSEREIWSKLKNGAYDKLLRRESVTLETATYRVSYTTYLDTKVPNLMLTPAAATQRDGSFNASTQYRLFRPDGSYYTAIPPTP